MIRSPPTATAANIIGFWAIGIGRPLPLPEKPLAESQRNGIVNGVIPDDNKVDTWDGGRWAICSSSSFLSTLDRRLDKMFAYNDDDDEEESGVFLEV